MNRKGISPLIGAVLLIAFTMAIASIFAQFAPNVIEDARGRSVNQSQNLAECANTRIDLINRNKSFAQIQQIAGERPARNLTATFFYNGTKVEQDTANIQDNNNVVDVYVGDNVNPEDNLERIRVDIEGCPGAPGIDRDF